MGTLGRLIYMLPLFALAALTARYLGFDLSVWATEFGIRTIFAALTGLMLADGFHYLLDMISTYFNKRRKSSECSN